MLAAHPGVAQEATHVRAVDPVIGPLIARGIERSATFRGLVRAIDSSDSYLYMKGRLVCSKRARLPSGGDLRGVGQIRVVES